MSTFAPAETRPYGGLLPRVATVTVSRDDIVVIDVDDDSHPDITHNRASGQTLIWCRTVWDYVMKSAFKASGVFRHRVLDDGRCIEVNLVPESDGYESASRPRITPQQEEHAEVTHAATLIGFCGPLGSPCSTLVWHEGGKL